MKKELIIFNSQFTIHPPSANSFIRVAREIVKGTLPTWDAEKAPKGRSVLFVLGPSTFGVLQIRAPTATKSKTLVRSKPQNH